MNDKRYEISINESNGHLSISLNHTLIAGILLNGVGKEIKQFKISVDDLAYAIPQIKELQIKAKKYDDKETLMKPKIEVINDYVECHYVCSYEIACCPQCGLKVDFGDDYCKRCGQHLDNDF